MVLLMVVFLLSFNRFLGSRWRSRSEAHNIRGDEREQLASARRSFSRSQHAILRDAMSGYVRVSCVVLKELTLNLSHKFKFMCELCSIINLSALLRQP